MQKVEKIAGGLEGSDISIVVCLAVKINNRIEKIIPRNVEKPRLLSTKNMLKISILIV